MAAGGVGVGTLRTPAGGVADKLHAGSLGKAGAVSTATGASLPWAPDVTETRGKSPKVPPASASLHLGFTPCLSILSTRPGAGGRLRNKPFAPLGKEGAPSQRLSPRRTPGDAHGPCGCRLPCAAGAHVGEPDPHRAPGQAAT